MLEQLINLDHQLFYFINETISNTFFDAVLPFLRNKSTWIPLYLFLVYFIFRNHKKQYIYIFAFAILTIAFSDTLSSRIIKQNIKRSRPCKTENLIAPANHRISSCAGYSFTSSHATNHFAMAFFLGLFFLRIRKRKDIFIAFLFWAAIISFSQIYVGVHFPLDILFGTIIGSAVGIFTFNLLNIKLKKLDALT